jgi:hypothetical protein
MYITVYFMDFSLWPGRFGNIITRAFVLALSLFPFPFLFLFSFALSLSLYLYYFFV